MVQTPTELDMQHIYTLDVGNNLPLGIIPLAVDHKIDQKYPKSLNIPILNTTYDRVHIPRATVVALGCIMLKLKAMKSAVYPEPQ